MSASEAPTPNQVFIGGLAPETTLADLNKHVADLGLAPVSSSLFEDAEGKSKGCALVLFGSEEFANAAIAALDSTVVGANTVSARMDRGARRSRPNLVNEDPTYIYIGNLTLDVTKDDLSPLLAKFGSVTECNVDRKRRPDAQLGWATVQFATEAEAAAAIAGLAGQDMKGQPMTCEALKRPPRGKKARNEKKKKAANASEGAAAPAPVVEANPCVLYVGNLPWTIGDDELLGLFAAFGSVVKAEIVRDSRNGKSRGWGTVEMDNAQNASAAIASLNATTMGDRDIEVQVRQGGARRSRKKGGGEEGAEKPKRERKPRNKPTTTNNKEEGDEEAAPRRRRRRKNKGESNEGEASEPRERAPRERKEREPTVVSNPDCHLFVGNLPWDVTNEALTTLFAKHGTVTNATITQNRRADRSRGWGTVEMGSNADATAAVAALNEFTYADRQLIVRFDTHVTKE